MIRTRNRGRGGNRQISNDSAVPIIRMQDLTLTEENNNNQQIDDLLSKVKALKLSSNDYCTLFQGLIKQNEMTSSGTGWMDKLMNSFGYVKKDKTNETMALICREDLFETQKLFFIDIVTVEDKLTHKNIAGEIAVVDISGTVLLWSYIKRDECTINRFSGLDEPKLKVGLSIEQVPDILLRMLSEKTLYGFGVKKKGYFGDLGFNPYRIPSDFEIEDLELFYSDSAMVPIPVTYLREHFIGGTTQQDSLSSAISGARFVAKCYKEMKKFAAGGMPRFICPVIEFLCRPQTSNPGEDGQKWGRCTCNDPFDF